MLNDALIKVRKTVKMLKAELMPTTEDNSLTFLSFNEDNYYYSRLTKHQKTVYSIILTGLLKIDKEISIPLLSIEEISTIFSAVIHDNPMLFYVSAFSVSSSMYSSHCSFIPNYKYDKQFILQNIKIVNNFLHVFDKVKSKSDVDKEMYVHDYCLENFSYDYSFSDYSYSVLGPILNKTAVCDGIAKFVKLALDYLEVPCLVVSGQANNPMQSSAMEGHSWNIVSINKKCYHLDVTWDLCLTRDAKRYDYYNLCDEDILKDHVITEKVPVCNTQGQDYYSKNGLIANNPEELKRIITARLKNGEKRIMVKLNNVQSADGIVDKVSKISMDQYMANINKSVKIEIGSNLSQMVFEICYK